MFQLGVLNLGETPMSYDFPISPWLAHSKPHLPGVHEAFVPDRLRGVVDGALPDAASGLEIRRAEGLDLATT